jgi:hypothetical protein
MADDVGGEPEEEPMSITYTCDWCAETVDPDAWVELRTHRSALRPARGQRFRRPVPRGLF